MSTAPISQIRDHLNFTPGKYVGKKLSCKESLRFGQTLPATDISGACEVWVAGAVVEDLTQNSIGTQLRRDAEPRSSRLSPYAIALMARQSGR